MLLPHQYYFTTAAWLRDHRWVICRLQWGRKKITALAQEAHFRPAESSLQSNQWWSVIKLHHACICHRVAEFRAAAQCSSRRCWWLSRGGGRFGGSDTACDQKQSARDGAEWVTPKEKPCHLGECQGLCIHLTLRTHTYRPTASKLSPFGKAPSCKRALMSCLP